MNSTIIVALISFAGTVVGTAGGIMASSKLTAYRIEQLEKKMEAQAAVYSRVPVMEEKIKTINRRIAKLERENVSDFCSVN
ncbi:MAG: hypothetical protein IKJ50_00735 [Clostridia bacterium]|nr:hypothetical protein [Clostridia bacterium]